MINMSERKQLIEKLTSEFKETILENIYDMSNKELKMADLIRSLLTSYKNLNIMLPEDKKHISSKNNHFTFI